MSYRIGNKDQLEALGETLPLACPHCKKTVSFSVFSNGNMDIVPQFPIIKNSKIYFLICPECASAFTINEAQGKSFKKGEALSIGNFDLKELESFDV